MTSRPAGIPSRQEPEKPRAARPPSRTPISPRRLTPRTLVENLVLALPGALIGVALASFILPFIASGAASSAPSRIALDTSVDIYVLAFAVALASACALVFGFVPALRASRVELTTTLNDLSPRRAARGHLRSMLVVSQVAVTRLLDALAAEPIFTNSTVAANVPMSLVDNSSRATAVEGYAPRSDEDMLFLYNVVAPDYFGTMRIPVLAGRDFTRTDDTSAQPAVIINETMARRFWKTPPNAVGKRLRSGTGEWRNIIGVVRDVKYSTLSEAPRPFVYYPMLQNYVPTFTVHARSGGDLTYAMRRVRDHLQSIDPAIPITRSTTLTEQTRVALTVYELAAGALTMFGVMTIVLSAIGIYGLVSYTVRQSTQEIGIRMAIGARRADVVWTFLRRGFTVAAVGAVIGLVMAFALSGAIGSLLYGVGSRDLLSFGAGTAIVVGVALAASLLPAMRASRTDPLTALRHR